MKKDLAKQDNIPAYINQGEARGNENVTTDDLVIPRLGLLQKISPELDKNDPAFIKGAEEGQFVNSLTKEVHSSPAQIVPVFYRKEFVVFKKREAGGGFRGTFQSDQEAQEFISQQEDATQLESIETGNHFCFLIKEDGSFDEVTIPMTSTKLKISRQLNSLIRLRGGDRWAGMYLLGSTAEKNDMGSFYNISIANAGWAPEDAYKAAEEVYEQIKAGVKTADYGDDEKKEEKEF